MINISDFLEKFKKFDQDKTQQTEKILNAIEKIVGVKLERRQITIKDGVLFVQCAPVVHQEIFMQKENLLSLIKTEGIFDIK